jgi:hypothetical protein
MIDINGFDFIERFKKFPAFLFFRGEIRFRLGRGVCKNCRVRTVFLTTHVKKVVPAKISQPPKFQTFASSNNPVGRDSLLPLQPFLPINSILKLRVFAMECRVCERTKETRYLVLNRNKIDASETDLFPPHPKLVNRCWEKTYRDIF